MSLAILIHLLCAQHVSDINISIFRLLKMDILMSETCRANNKWNKIASDIKLVFHSSTIAMMHGPINIKYISSCNSFTTTSGYGRGSSVGIATDYGLDGPRSNSGGDKNFRPSRPALRPTQPPVKCVPGLFPGVKCGRGVLLTTHPLLVPWSWKSRAIPLPTLRVTPGL